MKKDLHDLSPAELGRLFPIILVEHDPEWPSLYLSEEAHIMEALGKENIARIDHIGSTAVAGLISKPTLDILLQVKREIKDHTIKDALTSLDFLLIPKPENPPPHMMFVKGYTPEGFEGQTVHVHVRYPDAWDEIPFRDYLRAHPEAREEYARIKKELAVRYEYDRDGYTDAKTPFISGIMKRARS